MEQSITLRERGIVIVGQNHNPSILNPDFLWRHRIVPEEAALAKSEPAFSTPVSSHVAFENGLHIVSEPGRISFVEINLEASNIPCYGVAINYLRTVPLVRYTAVGINFSGFFPALSGELTPHNMLKTGGWKKFEDIYPLTEIGLTYPLVKRTVNLTIKREKIPDLENEQKVIVRGNFHHNIQVEQGESYKVAIANVGGWEDDLKCFETLSDNIVKGIGG